MDLVPAGSHAGGSGQLWDRLALENYLDVDLGNSVRVRHADAPAFLALKWAAFADRGRQDPFGSHDLEDILALIASRPTVVGEIEHAPKQVKAFVVANSVQLLADAQIGDLPAAHLNNAQDARAVSDDVVERLELVARLETL
jgi:hypothetical protein